MIVRLRLLFVAIVFLPISGNLSAQARQTAEGAQQFLYSMSARPDVSIALGLPAKATFSATGSAATLLMRVQRIDSQSPCATVIAEVNLEKRWVQEGGDFYSTNGFLVSATPEDYSTPIIVSWGDASIRRGGILDGSGVTHHTISATFSKSGSFLRFSTTDSGLADRVEYAAKFLQASCDASASTGF